MTTADALSRAPSSEPLDGDKLLQDEADVYVKMVVKSLPATEGRVKQIQQHQEKLQSTVIRVGHKKKRSHKNFVLTFL